LAFLTSVAGSFNFAEEYHQQYLAKYPGGYWGPGRMGIAYPNGRCEGV
jgi:peptide methionine sulfoxide reductase MsrA